VERRWLERGFIGRRWCSRSALRAWPRSSSARHWRRWT